MPIPIRSKRPRAKVHYDTQWRKTAKNKIKKILGSGSDKSIADKYKKDPKWKGKKVK